MGFKKTYAKIFPFFNLFVFRNKYSLFLFSIFEGQIVPMELFEINSSFFLVIIGILFVYKVYLV